MDGIVTERHLVQGEVVNTEKMLFQVVDTSSMWLRCSVPLEDTKLLALGQTVEFRPDGGQFDVPGRISWISTDVDVETRTVEVRSELENSKGLLRNNTFGTGKIILRTADKAVQVPSEAVQWDGNCFVVFVRDRDYFDADAPKLFYTRSVRPGVENAGKTEIIAGLLPGEIVATRGSGVLRAQILKNNLGAGCTCGH
jgi:RND family efflux transporter MFP subunit